MTGLGTGGGGGFNLFPDGLFPEFSGPLLVGGGHATALAGGDDDGGGVLRVGFAALQFRGRAALAPPRLMVVFEVLYGFGNDVAIIDGGVHAGVGPVLVGAGIGAVMREAAPEVLDRGLVISPELSLPLRLRGRARFAPSIVLFARLDVIPFDRVTFADQLTAGATFVGW